MKIFLSCQQSAHDYPIPAYRFWSRYFRQGLIEAGHEIREADVDWARGLLPLDEVEIHRWREAAWNSTVTRIRNAHDDGGVDLFLSYLYPQQISADAIREIQNLGVPCVNFFCDHVREYRTLPEEFAPFNLHWVPEFKALPLYRARGSKCVHAPMPCWIEPELRHVPAHEEPVVSFIGGRDPLRAALLAEAARAGLPLEIRGANWLGAESVTTLPPATLSTRVSHWREFVRRQGPRAVVRRLLSRFAPSPVDFDSSAHTRPMPSMDDYQRIIAQSSVSLGINRYPSFRFPAAKPDTYSRLRDIEAPMLGACYLTEWTEGLDELYDLEQEIAVYRTAEEMIEQSRALLADQPRRLRLRTAGQRRALQDHSISRSVARIASQLGLSAP